MRLWSAIFAVLTLTMVAAGCGKDDDEGNDGGGGDSGYAGAKIILKSESLSLSLSDPTTCTATVDNYRGEGVCLSPLSVTGVALDADLHGQGGLGGGTRIMGTSTDEEEDAKEEPDPIVTGPEFDFADGDTLKSNNRLQEVYENNPTWDSLVVNLAYYKIKFELQDKFVTMLLAKFSQPFAESSVVTNCEGITAEDRTQARFTESDILEGLEFERGDYLFCVKDSETESCSASDFKWLDLSDNSLTSTRPSNPKVSGWNKNQELGCSTEGEHTSFDLGVFGLFAEIPTASQFKLRADYSHGELSNQWEGESQPLGEAASNDDNENFTGAPYLIYYYEGPDGTQKTGTDLTLELNFDTSNMIYIDDIIADPGEIDDHSLGALLAKTHTVGQWGFDNKDSDNLVGYDANDMASMSATIGVTLTGGTEAPEGAADDSSD